MAEVPHPTHFDAQSGDLGQDVEIILADRPIGRDLVIQNSGNGSGLCSEPAPITPPRARNKDMKGPPPVQIRARTGSVYVAHQPERSLDQGPSPRGIIEADDVFCCSPTAWEATSPSFSTAMSSPAPLFTSPTAKSQRGDSFGSEDFDGAEKLDGAPSFVTSRRQGGTRNGYARRRSSTGSTGTLCGPSRDNTLVNVPDSPTLTRAHVPPKQLACCDEADEISEKLEELERLERLEVPDDGKGISDVIWPMLPVNLERLRYKFRKQFIDKNETSCTFKPRQRKFDEPNVPIGWRKVIGPEGFPYFWNATKQVITGNWIMDPETLQRLSDFLVDIDAYMEKHEYRQESDVHLVVDMHEVEGTWWCGYYFVDHGSLSVFWYENKVTENQEIFEIAVGELSTGLMRVYSEWEYWKHWGLFPDLCPPTEKIWKIAENYIRNAQTDVLTADCPATNFSFDKLKDMMSVLLEAKASYLHAIGKSGIEPLSLPLADCPWFIGRFMEPLARERYINCYGERHARIEGMQSIHGEGPRLKLNDTSLAFRILSPVLFWSPEIHLKKMELLWVDQVVYQEPWNHFFDSLSQDWTHQLVYASILLTSNIAFLTVPNVTLESAEIHGTFVQIPSYMSTIATIGSIILGLVLNKQHQNRTRSYRLEASTAPEIHEWLTKRNHSTRGLEPLAVMYSLPFALLMWGMVTFLASFAAMCFFHMTKIAIAMTAASMLAIVTLGGWFWWMSWDNTTNRWASIYEAIHSWRPFDFLRIGRGTHSAKDRSSSGTLNESFSALKLENGTAIPDAISLHSRGSSKSVRSLPRPEPVYFSAMTLQKTRSRDGT